MGVYGFVCAGGGSVGVLLGGVLTSALSWHWIFLVNIPVGLIVYLLSLRLIPNVRGVGEGRQMDVAGAITVTASLMLAVYAIVNEPGRVDHAHALTLLLISALLLASFIWIKATAPALMPLKMFRLRNGHDQRRGNIVGGRRVLLVLYRRIRLVLGYSCGWSGLPAGNLIWRHFHWAVTKLVMRLASRNHCLV
jgi:MFS family permease